MVLEIVRFLLAEKVSVAGMRLRVCRLMLGAKVKVAAMLRKNAEPRPTIAEKVSVAAIVLEVRRTNLADKVIVAAMVRRLTTTGRFMYLLMSSVMKFGVSGSYSSAFHGGVCGSS